MGQGNARMRNTTRRRIGSRRCVLLCQGQSIKAQDFNRAVSKDDNAGWYDVAQAPIITDRNGLSYCAIPMPSYVVPEEDGAVAE